MLDRTAAESRRPIAASPSAGRRSRGAAAGRCVACAVLVLAAARARSSAASAARSPGATRAPRRADVGADDARRALPAEAADLAEAAGEPPVASPPPVAAAGREPPRRPREPAPAASLEAQSPSLKRAQALRELLATLSRRPIGAAAERRSPSRPDVPPQTPEPTPRAAAARRRPIAAPAGAAASAPASAGRRRCSPPAISRRPSTAPSCRRRSTLHYEVRRGFLRGTGEIRWQPSGDAYRLVLEARIAGLTLLMQTSEGGIDANGLAPVRFLDQRARRSAQAANFRRDDGKVTFSGTGVEWPLLAGSQDRLSWMIQLAGIAAAEPRAARRRRPDHDGRRRRARRRRRLDPALRRPRERSRPSGATVHAVKLVREARSAYDTSAEIWLDPERSYLPAHATLRNSAGAPNTTSCSSASTPPLGPPLAAAGLAIGAAGRTWGEGGFAMHMLYNSDSFTVVAFDIPARPRRPARSRPRRRAAASRSSTSSHKRTSSSRARWRRASRPASRR